MRADTWTFNLCDASLREIRQFAIVKPWPNGDASWRKLKTWINLQLRLATCADLRWLALTLVEIKFARKSTQVFHRLAVQNVVKAICGFNRLSAPCWSHSYIDNGMTKFMIYNRTDAWKTDVNLLNLHNAGEEANWDYVEQYRIEDLTKTARFQIQPLKIRHAAFCQIETCIQIRHE